MMLAPLLATAAAMAQGAPPPTPKTSLFIRCNVKALAEPQTHEFNLFYFSQPPEGAQRLNLRDPDAILPPAGRPLIADAWPTAILVNYESAAAPKARLGALLIEPVWMSQGKAEIIVDRVPPTADAPTRFTGECAYSEGETAEREFLELTK